MQQSSRALASERAPDIRQRIAQFISRASTEITPHDESLLPALASVLPAKATVYVAHTPKATLSDVVRVSIALQQRGLCASPHIAARRLTSERVLNEALQTLLAAGIEQILLIAGDIDTPAGPFAGSLEVLESGILADARLRRIGFAGHPHGHRAIDTQRLWSALKRKQDFARSTGKSVHVATQFGFNAEALEHWVRQLRAAKIDLPVHVGLAGPTSLPKLPRFAAKCGVATALQSAFRNPKFIGGVMAHAATPGDMLSALVARGAGDALSQIVQPHIFTFGAALTSAHWIRAVADGAFDLPRAACIDIK